MSPYEHFSLLSNFACVVRPYGPTRALARIEYVRTAEVWYVWLDDIRGDIDWDALARRYAENPPALDAEEMLAAGTWDGLAAAEFWAHGPLWPPGRE